MKHIFLIFSIFLVMYLNLNAQELNIYSYKLDNGLTVILNEDHTNPKVFGSIVCKAGGKNDPVDATGMAHYQEHMLFKGTQKIGTTDWASEKVYIDKIFALYDKLGQTKIDTARANIQQQINDASLEANKFAIQNELSNLIKSIGGTDLNAGTGWDMTVYYNAFPPNQIEKWLELYSARFENPVFRGFQQELEVVYEEKNLYSDIFIFPLLEQYNKQFFKNHPYGQQTLVGNIENLKNPSLTKMYDFFKTYYVPNNMALIISGDFNKDEIMPMIKEKFGDWKSSEVPANKVYEEKPFIGREFIEVKLSPIKLEFLGFRTVPQGNEDEIPLQVFNALLSNSNQTGLFDKLMLDNKLLAAQVIAMPYFDHGATIFLAIPKLIGQSLEEAEQLLLGEIKKIKNGEIDEKTLSSIKNQLYVDNQLEMENLENVNYLISQAFALNKNIEEYLLQNEKIKNLTLDDIKRVANKYFGENYMVMYSKMGSLKKEKIDKPDYEPLIANTDAKSEFTKSFEKIKDEDYKISYINFDKDIKTEKIADNNNFYYTENPKNDIFTLELKFGIGKNALPLLDYATTILNVAGTDEFNTNQIKQEFSNIGCTYSFNCDNNNFYINLEGMESNLKEAVQLLNKLINNPKAEQDKIELIIDSESSSRKMERAEPDNIADALKSFVLYNNKSKFLDRLTLKEIKKLQVANLLNEYKKVLDYAVEIHYVGSSKILSYNDVLNLIKTELKFNTNLKPALEIRNKIEKYNENTVYFVNKRKATQSKIYIIINGKPYDISQEANIDAFNLYFGGDFSGLVLQEIREYRSLAYSAGARIVVPDSIGAEKYFVGYVGTQADKTLEALEVFDNLLKDMPSKPERLDMIKSYLKLSIITSKPDFRKLSEEIVDCKKLGYNEDPIKVNIEQYEKLKFDDINKFYQDNIKAKPIVFAIVGDKKRIDMKKLKTYGKMVEIKEKNLFK